MKSFLPLAPAVRIACVVAYASGVARGHLPALALAVPLLLVPWLVVGVQHARPGLRILRRLRWLLLSIAVLYGWFTPGAPIAPVPASPTWEGVAEGVQRASALVLIVMAVQLLLHTTSREELLAAAVWIPRRCGATSATQERLALRMVLTLRACQTAESLIRDALRTEPAADEREPASERVGGVAARVWREALKRAHDEPCDELTLPCATAPPGLQWTVPAMLAMALWTL